MFCPGGGGVTSICMNILGSIMCRTRDPHFQPWISVPEHIDHFHKLPKNFVPEHHHFTFFGGFCRSGDHHFQNAFNFNPFIGASHGWLSPFGSAAASWQFRRGAFSRSKRRGSFRCPAFSHSKRLKFVPEPRIFKLRRLQLVPEPRIFTLDRELIPEPWPNFHFAAAHTVYTKIWGEYSPPPPPPPGVLPLMWTAKQNKLKILKANSPDFGLCALIWNKALYTQLFILPLVPIYIQPKEYKFPSDTFWYYLNKYFTIMILFIQKLINVNQILLRTIWVVIRSLHFNIILKTKTCFEKKWLFSSMGRQLGALIIVGMLFLCRYFNNYCQKLHFFLAPFFINCAISQ